MNNQEYKKKIEKEFPAGTRVKLIKFTPDEPSVPSGSMGTVIAIDDAAQIHVRWDCGSSLALIPQVDLFEKIS